MSPTICSGAGPATRLAIYLALVLPVLAASAGCSSGGAKTPSDGAAGAGTAGTGAAGTSAAGATGAAGSGDGVAGTSGGDAIVGAFNIRLVEQMGTAQAYTTIAGSVSDGPSPALVGFVAGATAGGCTLYTPHVPFCSTPCGGTAVCVDDDTCRAYPKAKSVGTVTVTGVATVPASGGTDAGVADAGAASGNGTAPFALTLTNGTYQAVGVALAYPPFAEGADVSVATSGGDYAAFALHAKGVAPLSVGSDAIMLQKNQALTLTWSAAGASADSTIHVKLDVSSHGGTKGKILCDAPDTGSLTISAALVTQLLNLGTSGFPSILVTRTSMGTASIAPGRVQLNVTQDIERSVTIPGLISCSDTLPCPTGQTCQDDFKCQ